MTVEVGKYYRNTASGDVCSVVEVTGVVMKKVLLNNGDKWTWAMFVRHWESVSAVDVR